MDIVIQIGYLVAAKLIAFAILVLMFTGLLHYLRWLEKDFTLGCAVSTTTLFTLFWLIALVFVPVVER